MGYCYRNSFAHIDGKRSICRGFREDDMARYLREAGLEGRVSVQRWIPGRIVLISG
jgi:hypothetical protein